MKYRLIKQKALFEIFLIISLSFYTSFSLAALNQGNTNNNEITYFDLIKQDLFSDVDAQNKVCCEITKQDSEFSGLSCVYTEVENCSPNSKKDPISCDQTNYCQPGVCILNNVCKDNVEKGLCEQTGGVFRSGTSAEISQCQIGCCNLPTGASLTTEAQCANAIKDFSSLRLNEVFDENVKDESTCVQRSRGTEEGCCVLSDQCSFGTRKECTDLNGGFKLNTICSYPELGCPVTSQHSTTCYQGKVYWTDSSGNRENIYGTTYRNDGLVVPPSESCNLQYDARGKIINDINCGNCEYSAGSTCDVASEDFKTRLRSSGKSATEINKIQNQCISLDCLSTERSKLYQGRLVNSWMDGGLRKNGESWCEYEGITGDGLDLVGSRHYRHICRNGVEIIEEAQTNRGEFCIQGEIPGALAGGNKPKLAARLVTNNWEICSEANNQDQCALELDYNEVLNQCSGECNALKNIGKDGELYECCTKQLCRKQSCESSNPYCYFNDAVKLCAPNVPPGTLSLSSSGNDIRINDDGNVFSYDCKEMWAIEGPEFLYDWNCAGNCKDENTGWCSQQSTVDAWNSYCRSLGDYGAKYNIESRYSRAFNPGVPKGYEDTDAYDWDDNFIPRNNPPSPTRGAFSSFAYADKPLNGTFHLALFALDVVGSRISIGELNLDEGLPNFNNWITGSILGGGTLALLFTAWTSSHIALFGSAIGVGEFGITGLFSSLATEVFGWESLGVLFAQPEFYFLTTGGFVILLAGIVLYILIDWILGQWAEQREVTYSYTCLPWQPPRGGADCNKCNDYQTCDKYKCESLGLGCVLKNEGSPGQEVCVYEDRSDKVPPQISPLPILPKTINDLTIIPPGSGLDGGYEFRQEIPAFSEVEIGIKTNERAQCKISRFFDRPYESESGNEMTNFFGNNLYLLEHRMKIPPALEGISVDQDRIEVEAGKINTFYVKCVDINDNFNERSYFIKFKVNNAPDISPPVIEEFSPINNAFIRYNLNQTSVTAYLNEPAQCKYSTVDQLYDVMPNKMTCSQQKVNRNQYGCQATFGLKQNQENTFYIRCKDRVNNTNTQSIIYNIKGTKPLDITQAGPTGNVLTTEVTLTLTTSDGAENGKANCFYSLTKAFGPDSIRFTSTNNNQHSTQLSLQNEKDYKFYLWCRDVAGNEDSTEVSFHTTTPNLNIVNAVPDNTKIYSSELQLQVTTTGGVEQNAVDCRYQGIGPLTGINDNKIKSGQETTHYKNITLQDGNYELIITCTDGYKSDLRKVSFEVDVSGKPKLIRVFKEGSLLNVVTDRASECQYSPTENKFAFGQGTLMVTTNYLQHSLQIANSKVFYIKCQDRNTKQIGPDTSNSFNVYP